MEKTAPAALRKREDAVEKGWIRNSNALMRDAERAIPGRNIFIDIS
jgi:hypothetical protein